MQEKLENDFIWLHFMQLYSVSKENFKKNLLQKT